MNFSQRQAAHCKGPKFFGLVLGFLLVAGAPPADAAEAGSASSPMLVTVEVVRPARVDSFPDSPGGLLAQVTHAEARITTNLRSNRSGRSDVFPSRRSSHRQLILVDVEY